MSDAPTRVERRAPVRSRRMQLPPPLDLPPGAVVAGRYRIVRRLGQGGMGIVFVAEHTALERQVALKVLAPDLARHETLVTRFVREARAASKIGHHHIVNVLDFGRTDEDAPFIVMELLAGLDLGRTLHRDGAFPLARAAGVTRQLCAAMGAAHAKGVVHRDLKPENVFLCDGDVVKVLDFGLARFADAQPLTQAGMVFGTPEYMAPEQARGERVDQRADVYAVGCILYEMLTGTVPYAGADAATVLEKDVFSD
jgi:serine/threonine-protein kinase